MKFGFFYTLRYYVVVATMTGAVIAMWYDAKTDWNDGPNTVETLQIWHRNATGQATPPPDLLEMSTLDEPCTAE